MLFTVPNRLSCLQIKTNLLAREYVEMGLKKSFSNNKSLMCHVPGNISLNHNKYQGEWKGHTAHSWAENQTITWNSRHELSLPPFYQCLTTTSASHGGWTTLAWEDQGIGMQQRVSCRWGGLLLNQPTDEGQSELARVVWHLESKTGIIAGVWYATNTK